MVIERKSEHQTSIDMNAIVQRRPIKSRSAPWARSSAAFLVKVGFTPNQVSLASIGAAASGTLFLILSTTVAGNIERSIYLGLASGMIVMRLLCNLLDGLMAVENGKQTKTGEIFNEFPDRLSDLLFFLGAGYAAKAGDAAIWLGLGAAFLALFTAYIRAFGARYNEKQDFSGVMAKPQRMWTLFVGLIMSAVESTLYGSVHLLVITLGIIFVGTLWTCVTRTRTLYTQMESGR